jgi:DNA-binding CsgD family transcriptional regulator
MRADGCCHIQQMLARRLGCRRLEAALDMAPDLTADHLSSHDDGDERDSHSRTWTAAWPAALFVLIAAFVAADLIADSASGISLTHATVELSALGVALLGVGWAVVQLRRAMGRTRALQRDLRRTQADLDHWRSEAQAVLAHLGTALEHQFQRWELTPAESDIALLILKGLSYKEVANARGTTERTVRHQALAVYRKAGFAGRAEMAAFFLQDLLLPPRRDADAGGAAPPVA